MRACLAWQVIPSAWLKLYGDDVGNSAILLGPSGNTWQVGVSRPKWVAFRVGWRTFAADNCLEKGDMLVFTLIGKSRFAVKIFDCRTCLEKESSLTATNTGCYDSRSPVLLGEKRKLQRDGSDTTTTDLKRICLSTGENNNLDEFPRNGNGPGLPPPKALSMFNSILQTSQRKCSLLDLNSKPLSIQHHHPPPCDSSGRSSFPEVNQQLLDAVDDRSLQEYASAVVYQPHPISIRSHDFDDECSPHSQSKAQVLPSFHTNSDQCIAFKRIIFSPYPLVMQLEKQLSPLHTVLILTRIKMLWSLVYDCY